MQLGHFSASVSVDGVQLSEYAPEYSADGKEATCWIPSESGKNFKIEWNNAAASASCHVSGSVKVDGISCGSKRMKLGGNNSSTGYRDSVPASASTRRPLVFGKQTLTDDDSYLATTISPDFGTIRLVINQVQYLQQPGLSSWPGASFEPQILHERSKKAIGHTVQFGTAFPSGSNKSRRTDIIKKLGTFVFKYRPIDLLRAEGIAPPEARVGDKRPASPTDILDLTLVDEDDVDVNEIKQLEARLSELKKKNVKRVKCEPSDVKKKIKSEGSLFKPVGLS
ncbi:hypothetical protein C8J57DRAFT_1348050 [Mycena rebaudengoi]|nr:hypothetical protein C8J57DRAFT_1348050 [Mycena rebaudengoi]